MTTHNNLTPQQQEIFEACLVTAGRALGKAISRIMSSDPREAAEFAYEPGGPSVDELEVMVRDFQRDFSTPTEKTENEVAHRGSDDPTQS